MLLAAGVAVALALIVAVCGALLRERRTAGLRDATEVEHLAGAPVLAIARAPKDPTTLPALYPGTAAADVFRQLRISLEAEASSDPVSLVVVAGVADDDVSVWLGANLAVSLANVHRQVLLVDGRVGDQESTPIASPETLGLYDVLTGADLGDALSAGPVDDLTVLPAGGVGRRAAETLLETRFAAAMSRRASASTSSSSSPRPSTSATTPGSWRPAARWCSPSPRAVSPASSCASRRRLRAVGVRLLGGFVLVGKRAAP